MLQNMNQDNSSILYYVHDPMCSWCWAFVPTWTKVKEALSSHFDVRYGVGGLAPDSAQVMPKDMQQTIQGYWRNIMQRVPGTEFNFDFWEKCEPRRSTYPACRAVIAAGLQQSGADRLMIRAIQDAYYLRAMNPSDDSTLIALAVEQGLDEVQFVKDLASDQVRQLHEADMQLSMQLQAQGYPSLVVQVGDRAMYVQLDYNDAELTVKRLLAAQEQLSA